MYKDCGDEQPRGDLCPGYFGVGRLGQESGEQSCLHQSMEQKAIPLLEAFAH